MTRGQTVTIEARADASHQVSRQLRKIANDDRILDPDAAPSDEAAFVSTDDVTFLHYDGLGHALIGPQVGVDVAAWPANRPSVMPSCS